MRRFAVSVWWATTLIGSVSLWAQASPPRGDSARHAVIISNTAYEKLPRAPVDISGAKALEEVLRDAQFVVSVEHDLNLNSIRQVLDGIPSKVRAGDVVLLYYSGYMKQEGKGNYLVPVDFDPASANKVYYSAYDLSRLQERLADHKPFLSMLVLDASWDTPKLSGQAGFTQPDLLADTWMFASAAPDQVTADEKIRGRMGFFTSALVKVLPQHGLDLTELVSAVKTEVESASKGTQRPYLSSTFGSKFYFHMPDPSGEKVNGNDRLRYAYIPSGKFWMGCVPASEGECTASERPRHRVEITKGFWLGQTEVTNLAYKRFADANKISFKPRRSITDAGKGDNLPVVDVSWAEAQKYCTWVAEGGRLPTEAEWERAARAGKDDEVYPYPDLNTSRLYANFFGKAGNDRFDDIAPVGQFNPNRYNLFDMAGNVWEWVFDWFGAAYFGESSKESPVRDPQGPAQADKGKGHAARGGSWHSDPKRHLRISFRESFPSGGNEVGFRCVVPDTPQAMKSFVN